MDTPQLNAVAVAAIRAAMTASGQTQAGIAAELDVSEATIRRRLSGETELTLTFLEQIAHAIGADPLVLIGGQGASVTISTGDLDVDAGGDINLTVTAG